jgi:hypothetical protein
MSNINCYLRILVIILIFFCVVLLYLKYKPSNFFVVPETKVTFCPKLEQVHYLDSRYEFPDSPPVNPITRLSEIIDVIKPSPDLYTPFSNYYEINDSTHSIIPPTNNPNELEYSGGSNVLIKIPLQMNEPNEYEQLRSQNVLVTPYNRNKYSNRC